MRTALGQPLENISSSVLNKTTFDNVVKLADDIHASSAPSSYSISAVRSAAPPSLDETQPGLQYPVADAEVNAIRNGRGGRGQRGGRGG